MKRWFVITLIFTLGAAFGAGLPRLFEPAVGQTTALATPTPVIQPMESSSMHPMPANSMMPMGGSQGGNSTQMMQMMQMQMMQMMMPMMRSYADRAYMGAMMEMHGSMMRQAMTGNADRDFLTMMIPHHQAAINMANTELQYGKDPKVRALAKQFITTQQREIQQMTSWLR